MGIPCHLLTARDDHHCPRRFQGGTLARCRPMSKLVLVIEDDPDQRRLLERMLVGSGWRVTTATDGESGLGAAKNQPPDAIVLDVMMPRLNGYQTCRQLKADPVTMAIPVIMCTSKDQPADQYWATEVGADAFLAKPVDISRLVQMLERLTEPR